MPSTPSAGERLWQALEAEGPLQVAGTINAYSALLAEQAGFTVECIYLVSANKGNSSQQMGEHGRAPQRRCLYVWRKPAS